MLRGCLEQQGCLFTNRVSRANRGHSDGSRFLVKNGTNITVATVGCLNITIGNLLYCDNIPDGMLVSGQVVDHVDGMVR